MENKCLKLVLVLTKYIHNKKKLLLGQFGLKKIYKIVFLVVLELFLAIISVPLYLTTSPKKLRNSVDIFSSKDSGSTHFQVYLVRRKISLITMFGAGVVLLLKFVFIGIVTSYLFGAEALFAAAQDWNFSTPAEYIYDDEKIQLTNGVAQLKSTSTITASGSTSNPGFTTNVTGWTYADWDQESGEVNIAGTRISNNGNPGGYIQINAPSGNNDELGGYYRQAFTTIAANPTATTTFDWRVTAFDSDPDPVTFRLYVFVDSGSGVPVIGQEVWSSPEISATTGWVTVPNLDVSAKLTSAGTYYLKVAMWIETPGGPGTGPFTVGLDNVQLSWTKTTVSYDANLPTIQPATSLALAGVTGWSSFTETATKNGGEIYYQLSSDDGITWQYWDGFAWIVANTPANSNVASLINTHIDTFSVVNEKISWKAFLSGNGSQQVILDNIVVGYTQNAVPVLQTTSVTQDSTSGYVHVNYVLQDDNNDQNSLVNYEYSLTGDFAGEQVAMTPVPGDPVHSGVADLSSSPAGIAHTFVWNAGNDLGNIFSDSIYIRLRASDGIDSSNYITFLPMSVDYESPIVSDVTAVQSPTSTDVQINFNLSDETAKDIFLELQVSSDGGLTWDIPVVSVNGDVGESVTSGNGKSIVWQSGSDFTNQEQENMMIHIRAKDKYQNQGSYIDSNIFSLDTLAPLVAVPVDLLAQPLAGATTVLVGGSFVESNPNSNNFYVAVNGEEYGFVEAGDVGTATPADKNISIGMVADGTDYVSAVKIEHTDDFGQMATNENITLNQFFAYVKPYTPPAPVVNNPGEISLDVTIRKHLLEADGLEYSILEATQNLYVQEDGTLGFDPFWQSLGTITVTGLEQPISQYNFQVKSRNSSDLNHLPSSESDFSSGASSNYQSPQIVINSVGETIDGTKVVFIDYMGTDFQNQVNTLTKFEYSLNGVDWQPMTEKLGVGSSGVAGLAFINTGTHLVFAWDVWADQPNIEDSAVFVRLESSDLITNSNTAVSAAFVVDTAGPVIGSIEMLQTIASDTVVISYDLADAAGANNTVALAASSDNGVTYDVPVLSVTGEVGNGIVAGLERSIDWDVGTDLPNQAESAMRVKITATDSFGNEGDSVESANFSIDTLAPVVSNVSALQNPGTTAVTVNYDLLDTSSSTVEFYVSSDSGITWTVATTTYLGDIGTSQAGGAKSFDWSALVDFPDQEVSTMRIRIHAIDNFGHESTDKESADFSVNTKVLSFFNIMAEQDVGAGAVTIHYDLNKIANTSLDISSDSGVSWVVSTTTLAGDVGEGITAGQDRIITWDAATDFNGKEKTTMRVRLYGVDNAGALSPYFESVDFSIDTADPLGLIALSEIGITDTSANMSWSAGVTDANFNHYELWYGENREDVNSRAGSALRWRTIQDPALNVISTISTVITSTGLIRDDYVKIWAVDDYGNESTIEVLHLSSFSNSTPIMVVENQHIGDFGDDIAIDIDEASPEKPTLFSVESPTNITVVSIFGLAEPGTIIELYDKGILVQQLDKVTDAKGQFVQTVNFSVGQHVLTVQALDFFVNRSEPSDPVNLNIERSLPITQVDSNQEIEDRIIQDTPILSSLTELLLPIDRVLDTERGSNPITPLQPTDRQDEIEPDSGAVFTTAKVMVNIIDAPATR